MSVTKPEIVVSSTPDDLAEAAAQYVVRLAADRSTEFFTVALSGGSTPRALYQRLAQPPARDQIDWQRIQVFFSDERFVPPDSPESNFHTANEALLAHVSIPDRFVHSVPTVNITPEVSAADYEAGIRRMVPVGESGVPRFDLVLLGLGPDGHTASLFPGTRALGEEERLVVGNYVPKFSSWRVTFTYRLINAARHVAFLVQGEEKASRVQEVMAGRGDLPAAGVNPSDGQLTWFLDRAAAGLLPEAEKRGTQPS